MVLTAAILLGIAALWLGSATLSMLRLRLGFRQALLYAPMKLLWRIDDRGMRRARTHPAPVIYVVSHQSRLDPVLMLTLLPEDTLHILDPDSAKAGWLEPFRALARTIAFNPEHVFVSRRLVRILKGNGRLAVYVPEGVEPDTRTFRLYRAVARIALRADASVVPVFIGGARHLPWSFTPASKAPRKWLPRLNIGTLEGRTVAQLQERSGQGSAANALFDHVAETRFRTADLSRGLFLSVLDAADRHGANRVAVEDIVAGPMTYRQLLTAARVLGGRFAATTAPGEVVGLLLPNANAVVLTWLGLMSAGRVAAMLNYTAGPANITAAVRTALIRTVVTSHAFVEKAGLQAEVEAAEAGGARIVWLEEVRASLSRFDKLAGALLWRVPIGRVKATDPAVILFTSGSEGAPKAVVLSHRNLLANAWQVEARIAISPQDKLLNVLPVFHCFGLTGGTILPLVTGVRLFLYPSPLHYKQIPQTARKHAPTIMFGTDTFLAAYARTAADGDFSSLRLVVAGAEALKAPTRLAWRERFGAEIVEGFGLTEAAPVVAVNSATHGREATVGRLLPGMRMRLEPVEGIADGGRLLLQGPNVMLGYMTADRPCELQPLGEGWHDTGDIVSVDRDGFITIRGRAKRFAKIAGEMVSLGAVEALAHSLWPEERHAAVAVPDARRGERVVLVSTEMEGDLAALRRHCKASGAAELMVPGDLLRVEEIPLLGTGKTDYAAVRNLVMESLGIEAAA